MAEGEQRFEVAVATIAANYSTLLNTTRTDIGRAIATRLAEPIGLIAGVVRIRPAVLATMRDEDVAAYLELRAVQLLMASNDEQPKIFESIKSELLSILRADVPKARKAGRTMIGCLLLGLDELPELSADILRFLASLTGRREGVRASESEPDHSDIHSDALLGLSRLLDLALSSEVFAFLAGMPHLRSASAAALDELSTLPLSVVSVASRKGGVGKSTLALATALVLIKRDRRTRVCIIDLDVTGPIWQYLFFPSGGSDENTPLPSLNRLVDIEQEIPDFEFGTPATDDVVSCIGRAMIPLLDAEIGILTFSDLPRTNRYLVQAIAANLESFTRFLLAILSSLSDRYDYVIIDNSPGLDPHPMITLIAAGASRNGLPIVLSSQHVPDLRGTFLELSDLRLVGFDRLPLWIINKADERTRAFFSQPHTVVEVAEMTRAYKQIMPMAPLVRRCLQPTPMANAIHSLPFDFDLAQPNVIDFAEPLTRESISRFLDSKLFLHFEKDLTVMLRGDRR